MDINKTIAAFFGVGYINKGGGTVAALITVGLIYIAKIFNVYSNDLLFVFTAITFIGGVYVSFKVEVDWGKDSKRVVIDEVFGMAISLLFLPINLSTLIGAFLLFRYFDIVKPLYIRKLENLKGGWGVMMDDLLAGVYTNLILQIVIIYF